MKIFTISPEDKYDYQSDVYESASFEDMSLTADTIDCLIDSIHEYGEIQINTYHNIFDIDGTDLISVTESVSDMFEQFKKWIFSILKKIRDFVVKFLAKFDVWFSKSLLTRENLMKLRNFHGSFDYKYGYYYTFSKKDTPMKPICDVRDDVKDVAFACNNLNQRDMNKFSKSIKDIMRKKMFEDKVAYINMQRGKIFNNNGPAYIDKTYYMKYLKAHFRNAEVTPKIIHVDKSYIDNIIKNAGEDWYQHCKDEIKAEEKAVRAIYTTITQYIDVIRKKIQSVSADPVNEDDYDRMFTVTSLYMNSLISITKEVNMAVMLYYSAKRDAIKEMAFQNNKIVMRAMKGVI